MLIFFLHWLFSACAVHVWKSDCNLDWFSQSWDSALMILLSRDSGIPLGLPDLSKIWDSAHCITLCVQYCT